MPPILKEMVGISPQLDDSTNADRVKNPTSTTPATFSLNWSYCENGTAHPTPEVGVYTFMGPSTSFLSGKERRWPEDNVYRVKAALDIMRKHGYRIQLPPEGWENREHGIVKKEDEESKKSPEIAFLEEEYYSDHKVLGKNTDDTVFVLTESCGWLQIRCVTKEAEDFVEKQISGSDQYILRKVPHIEVTTDIDSSTGVTMTTRTGIGAHNGGGISTLFELKKGTKIIAKALCSYCNSEMENAGPTIELFEVAKEWRGHGYGKHLLQVVTKFFEEMFLGDGLGEENGEEIKFNICYCTNRHACEWFLRQGFQNWDGIGEELGKYLGR